MGRERKFGPPKEIAALCRLSARTVYDHARAGTIVAEKAIGAGWTVVAQLSGLTGMWRLVPARARRRA